MLNLLCRRRPVHPLMGKAFGRGFSLIELMIGFVIIAILVMLAMPSFRTWMLNLKGRAAAESVMSGLQMARSEALRRNAPVFFEVTALATPAWFWRIGCVNVVANPASPLFCPAEIQSRDAAEGGLMQNGVLIVTVVSDGGSRVVFDNFGRKTATADDFSQLDIGVNLSFLSANDNRSLRILQATGGAPRMCDVKVAAPDVRACP